MDATGNIITGVTARHLSDNLFLEGSRIVNHNTFLSAGVPGSFPGERIENVIGGRAAPWTGGFVNVVFNF